VEGVDSAETSVGRTSELYLREVDILFSLLSLLLQFKVFLYLLNALLLLQLKLFLTLLDLFISLLLQWFDLFRVLLLGLLQSLDEEIVGALDFCFFLEFVLSILLQDFFNFFLHLFLELLYHLVTILPNLLQLVLVALLFKLTLPLEVEVLLLFKSIYEQRALFGLRVKLDLVHSDLLEEVHVEAFLIHLVRFKIGRVLYHWDLIEFIFDVGKCSFGWKHEIPFHSHRLLLLDYVRAEPFRGVIPWIIPIINGRVIHWSFHLLPVSAEGQLFLQGIVLLLDLMLHL